MLLVVGGVGVGVCHATSIAKREAETTCPLIHRRPAQECVGLISECWSPGQYDLDCSNGAEICCFDGCINVCGSKKVCKTIYESKWENVTKAVCELVEQSPVCVTVTAQECNDVTETVDEVVTSEVQEDVCVVVNEEICENVESEVCVPKGFLSSNPVCPVVEQKPVEECHDHPTSACWSPGINTIKHLCSLTLWLLQKVEAQLVCIFLTKSYLWRSKWWSWTNLTNSIINSKLKLRIKLGHNLQILSVSAKNVF